jgi:DNA-binding SARP family transcriptional activator/predicted ATPase
LLAYLAITKRAHSRDALAYLLEGDVAEEQARKQLRNACTALREQIGEYLLVDRNAVAFNQELPYWLDVEELYDTVEGQRSAVGLDILERAVALYHDDLLAGLTLRDAPNFEGWLLKEQGRIRSVAVQALQVLVDLAVQRADYATGITYLRRLLELEPWREESHRQLMLLLSRTGQPSAAVAQYEVCRRALADELDSAPQPETQAVYRRLRAGTSAPMHNLPTQPTTFVGRERELAQLMQWLHDPSCRLITIVGLGGSGKTSLAVQAAQRLLDLPMADDQVATDGVFLVSMPDAQGADRGLTAAAAARTIVLAIGRALDIQCNGGTDSAQQVVAGLRERALLLVLDNVEHLRAGITILSTLLRSAPHLKLLVTSRSQLQLQEEWVLELGGLTVPVDDGEVEQAAASKLFLQKAQQLSPDVPLASAEWPHIARICRLVQGLPLALLMAARWLRGMSCAAIATELASGIDLLSTTESAVPERQRSIRTVLAYTWENLPEAEQRALRQLTVFHGSFGREAALAVVGTLQLLLALRDSTLLGFDRERYAIHELMRHYATERLAARPEEEAYARDRHAAYFTRFVQQVTPALRETPGAARTFGAEIANVQLAWEWATAGLDLDSLVVLRQGLALWYERTGGFRDWAAFCEQAIAQLRTQLAATSRPAAALQDLLGCLYLDGAAALVHQGHCGRAREALDQARAMAQSTGTIHLEGTCAYQRGLLLHRQGSDHAARQETEVALALARATEMRRLEADSLWHLGALACDLGDYPRARSYAERALPIYGALGDRLGEARARSHLGLTCGEQGDYIAARKHLEQALRASTTLEYHLGEMLTLNWLGRISGEGLGRHAEAESCFTESLRVARVLGERRGEADALMCLGRNALYAGGPTPRVRLTLERASTIFNEIGDQTGQGAAVSGLGLLAHYHGDNRRAQDHAQEAIQIAQESGLRRAERSALRLLGRALVELGDLTGAAIAYQRALEVGQILGNAPLAAEVLADLARVALIQGDLALAHTHTSNALGVLEGRSVTGAEEPVQIYLTCYHALHANDDPRAEQALAAGLGLLQERADAFPGEEQRLLYLHNIPAHRELLRTWHCFQVHMQEQAGCRRAPTVLASPTGPQRSPVHRDCPVSPD